MKRSEEEIQVLKDNWIKDPCWDIEDTEGFEDHKEELLAWRLDLDKKHRLAAEVRKVKRMEYVRSQTGIEIADKEILLSLHTFSEIESEVNGAGRFADDQIDLAEAQVRATLLLAAQIKRVADLLEDISTEGISVNATTVDKYQI